MSSRARSVSLTAFQKEKLKYYFKFYEPNEDNELDSNSIKNFMKRVLAYTGWQADSADAIKMVEIHENFFEVLFDKTSDVHQEISERTVTLDDWFSVWSILLPGCMSMNNFPVWLRLLPTCLFKMMDRDKDGLINEEELGNFYVQMVNLDRREAAMNAKLAYAQMTDNDSYPLNQNSYEQIFSNFLLGRTPHGPGRHIFGCFEHSVSKTPFTLIQPALKEDDFEMDVKLYLEKRPKRSSITGHLPM